MNFTLDELIKYTWRFIFWKILAPSKEFLRTILVLLLKNLPVHSKVIGPPKGYFLATESWFLEKSSKAKNYSHSYKEIYPSHKIARTPPQTIEDTIHRVFSDHISFESPAAFMAEISSGRVIGEGRAILTPDDYLLGDISVEYRPTPVHSVFSTLRLPPICEINETIAVIAILGGINYYHWLFDVLPRIYILEKAGFSIEEIPKILVNPVSMPFQLETLSSLGISKKQLFEAYPNVHIQAKRLLIPSLPGITGHPPDWVCRFLRQNFLRMVDQGEPTQLLYISRRKASRRQVLNEDEVFQILQKIGFKAIDLELLSFSEQVDLFSSAKAIVAPHGAGLANLVFCQSSTKVLEFFSPNYVNSCFWNLSNHLQLDHHYFIGEGIKPAEEFLDATKVAENILIDINKLSKALSFLNL